MASELAVRLAALATEQLRGWVAVTRPDRFTDAEWLLVADLVRVGIAAGAPSSLEEARKLRWIVRLHARVQLNAGTSRTLTGWYAPDAVQATLASGLPGVTARSLAARAGRLRAAAAALVPPPAAPALVYGRYDPHAPYSTAELTLLLDYANEHPKPVVGQRLTQLLWLVLGTGGYDAELLTLTGRSFRWGTHALLADLPGIDGKVAPRTVPVHHAAETPLAAIAAHAGDGSLWPGLTRRENLSSWLVERADLPPRLPRLTATRLRTTWLALCVAADVPLRALLPAAGVKGDRSFGHLLTALPPLPDKDFQAALRAGSGPLPTTSAQLLLPGARHPAPVLPLRTATPGGAP